MQTAIRQSPLDALRHQIDRTHFLGDGAEIGFCNADDRGRAAPQALHQPVSAGTNTGYGGSSPAGRWTRNLTRMPILTASGAMPSTRLISLKPSSQSMRAILYGAPSRGWVTVVA